MNECNNMIEIFLDFLKFLLLKLQKNFCETIIYCIIGDMYLISTLLEKNLIIICKEFLQL